jgi:hypothetical protein
MHVIIGHWSITVAVHVIIGHWSITVAVNVIESLVCEEFS